MDFYRIAENLSKPKEPKLAPSFEVKPTQDLMIRGKDFYSVWDESKGLWSKDPFTVARLIDAELHQTREERYPEWAIQSMRNFSSGSWKMFQSYLLNMPDSYVDLDGKLTFADASPRRQDYASKRLPYSLEDGEPEAYNELMSTLYTSKERQKLEWAIGAIVAGEAKYIQKFIVLYGPAGAGKSTVMNIIQDLFEGYYALFDARAVTTSSDQFATAAFSENPLVAIQHDGDLSHIQDNSRLNSIVSHEEILVNEKFKRAYPTRVNAFLFMGTNKAVKITDSKSGLTRRLIDVYPSGEHIPVARYHVLVHKIKTELGRIAKHCLDVYTSLGADAYHGYIPVRMLKETNQIHNFVNDHYLTFASQDDIGLQDAWELYTKWCDAGGQKYPLSRIDFRTELAEYFSDFVERKRVLGLDGEHHHRRGVFSGFKKEKFDAPREVETRVYSLVLDKKESLLDEVLSESPAQYTYYSNKTRSEVPTSKWDEVSTTLADLDTSRIHYVKPPVHHIVIDFDLTDEKGDKSAELNIAAASQWPTTYAEFSQGGSGIHLHYEYRGDVSELSNVYSDGVEIKTFVGQASLRRRLSLCNGAPIATLNRDLPKREVKLIDFDRMMTERGMRDLIERNLRKEIHPGTKPSIDFIKKILDDAYASGLQYDVTNLKPRVLIFALNSSHQSDYCVELVGKMHFCSEEITQDPSPEAYSDDRLVIYDLEVFPNLFHISWKYEGDSEIVRMVNPKPEEVAKLMRMKLVGFYNRRYDNHIIYAANLGYSVERLYELSQRLIANDRRAPFGEAYNLSYADIWDFASIKKSLKKWEIDLGHHHLELGLPWDKPVPKALWGKVAEYCDNDVLATEAVLEDRKADLVARMILADLSGLSVNDTTQAHTARIIFEGDRDHKKEFVYTDLSERFPGYVYAFGKSEYRGLDPSEGGYVEAETGMWTDVTVLDVASMHPSSARAMNIFGKYTKNYTDLLDARLAIKQKRYSEARKMLGGKLAKYLEGTVDGVANEDADNLAYALKISLNIVYGLTSAGFDNPFRDERNKDNIVAKRGALFMIDLSYAVREKGYSVVHIKTDSIKIPDADPEIISFVERFGKEYGYDFECEDVYDRMCLVNDAVYIAHDEKGWHATGAQFAHPYVFKTLFSREAVVFDDLCETKTVTTSLHIDYGDGPVFVGKAGQFTPVVEGAGGGTLLREKDGAFSAVGGTKGYLWMESEMVRRLGKQDMVDMSYYTKLADAARSKIAQFGDVEWFLNA